MYLNPVNASNQTFGCSGLSNFKHIVIYWIGPLFATILVCLINNYTSTETHIKAAETKRDQHKKHKDHQNDHPSGDMKHSIHQETKGVRKRIQKTKSSKT